MYKNINLHSGLQKYTLLCLIALFLLYGCVNLCCYAELRDPTKPEGYTELKTYNFELSAIITSGGIRKAVINGRILTVGAYLSEYEVISIESNKVVLSGPAGKIDLILLASPIKRWRN